MPPAPSGPRTSKLPRRVPGCRAMKCVADCMPLGESRVESQESRVERGEEPEDRIAPVIQRVLLFLAAAGLSVPAAGAPAEHTLAEIIERFESFRVEPSFAEVSDLRLTSGHLTLVCRSGRASLVRAGDETVGIFFQGSGTLEYQTADPVEFPLTLFNA